MKHELIVDDVKYTWQHSSCKCMSHCNNDILLVDDVSNGCFANEELCFMVVSLMEEIKKLRGEPAE